jgi:hypothetical protein
MTIHAVVTQTKHGTELLAEARRCLQLGVDMKAFWIKRVIDLIEEAAITDVTSWVQAVDNKQDGRDTAEIAAIT